MFFKYIPLIILFFSLKSYSEENIILQVEKSGYVGTFVEKTENKNTLFFEKDYIQNTEVLYFFSYDCLKCYAMYPHIYFWERNLKPLNVNFKRIPIGNNKSLSKLFFARKHLGFNTKFDNEIFLGINQGHFTVYTDENIRYFFDKYTNYDKKLLSNILKSENIEKKIILSEEIFSSIGNYSLPLIVVNKNNKRYIISPEYNHQPTEFIIALNTALNIKQKYNIKKK